MLSKTPKVCLGTRYPWVPTGDLQPESVDTMGFLSGSQWIVQSEMFMDDHGIRYDFMDVHLNDVKNICHLSIEFH